MYIYIYIYIYICIYVYIIYIYIERRFFDTIQEAYLSGNQTYNLALTVHTLQPLSYAIWLNGERC